MPASDNNAQARSETISSRVTPQQKADIEWLASRRDMSVSALLQTHSVHELLHEAEKAHAATIQ